MSILSQFISTSFCIELNEVHAVHEEDQLPLGQSSGSQKYLSHYYWLQWATTTIFKLFKVKLCQRSFQMCFKLKKPLTTSTVVMRGYFKRACSDRLNRVALPSDGFSRTTIYLHRMETPTMPTRAGTTSLAFDRPVFGFWSTVPERDAFPDWSAEARFMKVDLLICASKGPSNYAFRCILCILRKGTVAYYNWLRGL